MILGLRQQVVLRSLVPNALSTAELLSSVRIAGFSVSEDTIQRELKSLSASNLIISSGSGPSRLHELTTLGHLYVTYTDQDIDSILNNNNRPPVRYRLDIALSIANYISQNSFSETLIPIIKKYQQFIGSLDEATLNRWRQKWLIEFAWKSSAIEGNSYSELETETLLLDKIEARGKSHDEAVMIVNHQTAYDFTRTNKVSFKQITIDQILKIHGLLVNNLGVSTGIRKSAVRISGSKYIPLSHEQQLKENLDKIVEGINQTKRPLEKALISILLIAYLQPFVDGNKRTSRVLANAILEYHNYPPLTFGSIEPTSYRRACIAFYELIDIMPMIQIITGSYTNIADFE